MSNKHVFKGSSSINHCDYNDETNTMIIEFASGGVYHYPNCDKAHYEALKAASSPGRHFHEKLRNVVKGHKV